MPSDEQLKAVRFREPRHRDLETKMSDGHWERASLEAMRF